MGISIGSDGTIFDDREATDLTYASDGTEYADMAVATHGPGGTIQYIYV